MAVFWLISQKVCSKLYQSSSFLRLHLCSGSLSNPLGISPELKRQEWWLQWCCRGHIFRKRGGYMRKLKMWNKLRDFVNSKTYIILRKIIYVLLILPDLTFSCLTIRFLWFVLPLSSYFYPFLFTHFWPFWPPKCICGSKYFKCWHGGEVLNRFNQLVVTSLYNFFYHFWKQNRVNLLWKPASWSLKCTTNRQYRVLAFEWKHGGDILNKCNQCMFPSVTVVNLRRHRKAHRGDHSYSGRFSNTIALYKCVHTVWYLYKHRYGWKVNVDFSRNTVTQTRPLENHLACFRLKLIGVKQ